MGATVDEQTDLNEQADLVSHLQNDASGSVDHATPGGPMTNHEGNRTKAYPTVSRAPALIGFRNTDTNSKPTCLTL